MKGGTTEIAFVEDNTGYKWELIQKPGDFLGKKRDPILHVRAFCTPMIRGLASSTAGFSVSHHRRSFL